MPKTFTLLLTSLLVCAALLWQSCNIINPVEPTPTYIEIDSFQFLKNPLWPLLPATHQITNVSVYYNNNPIGVFDLPARVPIIANGTQEVAIFPSIPYDGLNTEVITYPFYKPDTLLLTASPGKIIQVSPVTEYYDDIVPKSISNFEGPSYFTLVGGNKPFTTVAPLPANDSLTEGGAWSGSLVFTAPTDSSINSSTIAFSIPTDAQDAFIEFDYKSTMPFYVGLQANLTSATSSSPYYLAGIYPSATWQKFYLEVANFNVTYQGTSYNFYLKASMPSGASYARLLIENIQLITF